MTAPLGVARRSSRSRLASAVARPLLRRLPLARRTRRQPSARRQRRRGRLTGAHRARGRRRWSALLHRRRPADDPVLVLGRAARRWRARSGSTSSTTGRSSARRGAVARSVAEHRPTTVSTPRSSAPAPRPACSVRLLRRAQNGNVQAYAQWPGGRSARRRRCRVAGGGQHARTGRCRCCSACPRSARPCSLSAPLGDRVAAPRSALVVSLATLAVSVVVAGAASPTSTRNRFADVVDVRWLPGVDVRFHLGVDGISPAAGAADRAADVAVRRSTRIGFAPDGGRVRRAARADCCCSRSACSAPSWRSTWCCSSCSSRSCSSRCTSSSRSGAAQRRGGRAATKFILFTLLGSAVMLLGFLLVVRRHRHVRHGRARRTARRGHGARHAAARVRCCWLGLGGQDARCGRCTPGCPTRTPRRRRSARCCWPACC